MAFKVNGKKLSRAKWKGSNYYRVESGTWRNKPTGDIYSGSPNRVGSKTGEREVTGRNLYGRDSKKV